MSDLDIAQAYEEYLDDFRNGKDLQDKFNMLFGMLTGMRNRMERIEGLLCEVLNRDSLEGYIDGEDVTFKVKMKKVYSGQTNYRPKVTKTAKTKAANKQKYYKNLFGEFDIPDDEVPF